jgi:hypothetical protein
MVREYNSKIYSRLYPWLLTWSDYGEDYENDGEEFNDIGVTRIRLPVSRP